MNRRRVFILGAGFSKAAGLPLATEATEMLIEASELKDIEDKADWLTEFPSRLRWMEGNDTATINVEQFFHYAMFDVEQWKMEQHLCPVNRTSGTTPYAQAEDIEHTLEILEEALVEVLWDKEQVAKLEPILRFARQLRPGDIVVTFNYDTLIEQALTKLGIRWNHGLADFQPNEVMVLKMHGSLDWFVVGRGERHPEGMQLLFSKEDSNAERHKPPQEEREYYFELWRINERDRLKTVIENQSIQQWYFRFGLTGLGSYKPLHMLPGSGQVWRRALPALFRADQVYVVGFSLSAFDGMARLHFASAMKYRSDDGTPAPQVTLIDPNAKSLQEDYRAVFGVDVRTEERRSEDVNWERILA